MGEERSWMGDTAAPADGMEEGRQHRTHGVYHQEVALLPPLQPTHVSQQGNGKQPVAAPFC